tara:strand:+ start:521 stop:2026 length:1506 start_codon:yes stop_codon:yes gene_type:complete
MKFKDPKIENLYEHLSKISKEAYKDPFLISNIIISKEESKGRLLENYLAEENPPKIALLFIFKKLLLYVIKNLVLWAFSIITAILHSISRQKFSIKNENELVLVDTYFIISNILETADFKDIFFPNLTEYLTKRKKIFAYTPRWFGSKQPFDLFRIFRIIKEKQIPVLTQHQILTSTDYLQALKFLFLYPFSVFRFMKKLESSYKDKLVRYALWEVLDGAVMENYLRFLFGQRLSSLAKGKIKCISWYENVSSEKNFYLGLRKQPKKIEIIGAQLFAKPHTLMNMFPDEKEIPFKVVPDKILVNGGGYLFNLDPVHVDTGPSFRYKYLFDPEVISSKREFVLVIMPYWDHVTSHILEVIKKVNWTAPIIIKFHPTTNWNKFKTRIPENSTVTSKELPLLLPKISLAVGHSTGALIEAAIFGIPSINIQHPEKFSHEYMPDIGKGILWDHAKDANEVEVLIEKFQLALKENPSSLKEEGEKMRSFCFSEPTDELIKSAFGLD